jgi:hypothetical protein
MGSPRCAHDSNDIERSSSRASSSTGTAGKVGHPRVAVAHLDRRPLQACARSRCRPWSRVAYKKTAPKGRTAALQAQRRPCALSTIVPLRGKPAAPPALSSSMPDSGDAAEGLRPRAAIAYLSTGNPVKPRVEGFRFEVGGSPHLVVIERQRRRSVARRAARRAEREALDMRRAGATCGCVRAGARAYFGPRPGLVWGRRHDGWWGDPAGMRVAAARSFWAVRLSRSAAICGEPAATRLFDRARRVLTPAPGRRRRGLAACGSSA